jgi:hypothetical protein
MFTQRAKTNRKTGDPDNQSLDKWSSIVLRRVKEERTFLHTVERRMEKRIDHILSKN